MNEIMENFKNSLNKKCKKCSSKCRNINCLLQIKKQMVEQDEYVANGLSLQGMQALKERDKVIGLRNLGATCYLNALLENWFHLSSFRNGIMSFSGIVTKSLICRIA